MVEVGSGEPVAGATVTLWHTPPGGGGVSLTPVGYLEFQALPALGVEYFVPYDAPAGSEVYMEVRMHAPTHSYPARLYDLDMSTCGSSSPKSLSPLGDTRTTERKFVPPFNGGPFQTPWN